MQKRKRILGAVLGTMLGLGLLFSPYAKLNTVYGANAPVAIDETNFPDVKFRSYLGLFDLDGNGEFSVSEIENITGISVRSEVTDLTGIEYLTNLKRLHCFENQLSGLDVSQNTALEKIECISCNLNSLDVSHNINLKELNCGGNQLSSLDVSQNTALERLNCSSNNLNSLDVSQNINLKELSCAGNPLNSLDVSRNAALETLECGGCNLNSLDVSQNTALERLNCSSNNLNSLDVSQNTALFVLECSENKLTSLDVSQNAALNGLVCSGNNLCSMDLSQNSTAGFSFRGDNNKITLPLYQSGSEYYIDLSSLPLDTGRVFNPSVGSYNAENGHIEGLTLDINGSSLVYQYKISPRMIITMPITVNISGGPIVVAGPEEPSTEGTTEKQDTAQTTEAVSTEQTTTQSTQAENTSQNTPKTGDTMLPVWLSILGLFSTICYFAARKGNGIK